MSYPQNGLQQKVSDIERRLTTIETYGSRQVNDLTKDVLYMREDFKNFHSELDELRREVKGVGRRLVIFSLTIGTSAVIFAISLLGKFWGG